MPRIDVQTLRPEGLFDTLKDPQVAAVAQVMPTRPIEPLPASPAAASTSTWNISAIGADKSRFTGAGVTVAVLDTGIDAKHPAFEGVEIIEKDFTGSGNGDRVGHGTHCAGIILGRDVGGQRIGVARGVTKLFAGKVLGDTGGGDSNMILQGIEWAVQSGANVISMSLGFDFPGAVERMKAAGMPPEAATSNALEAYRGNLRLFDALMAMVKAREEFAEGAVIVAAAGNESHMPQYRIAASLPAAAENVISVGALDKDEGGLSVAPFSNTLPQISAPGVDILSAKADGGLIQLSGTSMACPHVAGAAALWWECVRKSPLQSKARVVTVQLLARARQDAFTVNTALADRGMGLVTAP
ncbi:S8 family peptidase [Azospirillum argentinense]|nr:S8 family serine peptidase [Azospirillum argentinense]